MNQDRREYMRDYQRTKYQEDLVKARAYQQSIKLKKKLNLSDDLWLKYKHHLADVVRLQELLNRLPAEVVKDIMEGTPQGVTIFAQI